MIKGVVFDLDGLLIDSERNAFKVLNKTLGESGNITIDQYCEKYLGRTIADAMKTLKKDFGLPQSEEEIFNLFLQNEKESIESGIPLKIGAEELLIYLKEQNIKTVVASSSIRERAEKILVRNGISQYFDDLVFGYEVEHGKPAPDIFLKAVEKIGIEKNDAVVLEDSEAGIEAAHRANIPVICVPDIKLPSPEFLSKTSYVMDSLKDVLEWIKN